MVFIHWYGCVCYLGFSFRRARWAWIGLLAWFGLVWPDAGGTVDLYYSFIDSLELYSPRQVSVRSYLCHIYMILCWQALG